MNMAPKPPGKMPCHPGIRRLKINRHWDYPGGESASARGTGFRAKAYILKLEKIYPPRRSNPSRGRKSRAHEKHFGLHKTCLIIK